MLILGLIYTMLLMVFMYGLLFSPILYSLLSHKIEYLKLTPIEKAEILYSAGNIYKAKKILTPLAENKNIKAQFLLGSLYLKENYSEVINYSEAIKWWKLASKNGHAEAQFRLGGLYFDGEGTKKDYNKAIEFWELASENKHAEAQFRLGELYFEGKIVKKDYNKAIEFWELASKHKHAEAQFRLGELYFDGEGTKQDCNKAIEFWELASENKHAEAQFRLGELYFDGKIVGKDYNKAIEFWKLASKNGHAEAQFRLGELYFDGKNVEQNYAKAKEFLTLALANRYFQGDYSLQQQMQQKIQQINEIKNKERVIEKIKRDTPDERGNKMHELCALLMQYKMRNQNLNADEIYEYELFQEDIEKCKRVVNEVEKMLNIKTGNRVYIEHNIKGKNLKADGKPDIFVIKDKKAILLDYKTGKAKIRPPKYNRQLAAYAVLIMENFDVESVKGFIIEIDKSNLLQHKPHIFKDKNIITDRLNNIISKENQKSKIIVTDFSDAYPSQSTLRL